MEDGFLKEMVLKIISKVQRVLLKINNNLATELYYYLAKKHYKIYFDQYSADLETDVLNEDFHAHLAARRHARLVVSTLYKNINKQHKRMITRAAKQSFVKNIILNVKL